MQPETPHNDQPQIVAPNPSQITDPAVIVPPTTQQVAPIETQ